ncbi:hypothetical protein FACS189419_02070 [Planctomycetales bacterium]|nr:hypothetical protein FACS189419_02070 [Planctomycetales bacterium]
MSVNNFALCNLDKELLNRCLSGHYRSWEDFVDRFLGLVLHVIDYTVSKRDLRLNAENRNKLCEQVFAALCHNNYQLLQNFKEKSSLTTYLSVVTRRIVIRLLRNEALQNATKQNKPAQSNKAA